MTLARGVRTRAATLSATGGLPVCLNQEGLLAYEEINRSAGYQVPPANRVEAVGIRGEVNLRGVFEALDALVERHSVLRSRFEPTYGMPATMRRLQLDSFRATGICAPGLYEQSITSCSAGHVRTIRLDDVGASTMDRMTEEVIWAERCAPFDYTTPPLIRATLLHRRKTDFVLVIAVPLLVCDDESIEILLRELFFLYERAVGDGGERPLPPAGQFDDFAVRQRDLSFTNHFDPAAAYWRQRWQALESCQIDPSELEYAQPEMGRLSTGSIGDTLTLPATAAAGIRTCAERFDVAPYVLFLAAYGLFLGAATGRQRLAIWVNCANRGDDDSDRTVGWLMNRHAVEIDVSGASAADGFVEACRLAVVQTLNYQDLPLSLLWRRLGRRADRRGPSVTLAWRSGLIYESARLKVTRLEAGLRRMPLPMGVALVVSDHETGFTVTMIHSQGEFTRSSMRTALVRFGEVIDRMVLGAESGVGRLL